MTLTIQDLGSIGELLGSVAALVTLVYLALQTRQNTMAISAQLDSARINAAEQLDLTAATPDGLQEALAEDRVDGRTDNQTRRELYWGSNPIVAQWLLLQSRRGLLPSFNEAGVAAQMTSSFEVWNSDRACWELTKAGFQAEFVEWVEERRAQAA